MSSSSSTMTHSDTVEKAGSHHNETVPDEISDTQVTQSLGAEHDDLDRRTLWRLDLLLVPLMAGFYFLAWLDRANIGNARVVRAKHRQ
jgi:hypothetical protein